MSLSREELLQLMAYVDGEVEEGEIPEVLALLAKSDPGRRFVEQHSAVGEWVRASGEAHAVAARADDIVGAVMVRVAELGSAPGLAPVIVLEHGRAKTVRSRAGPLPRLPRLGDAGGGASGARKHGREKMREPVDVIFRTETGDDPW